MFYLVTGEKNNRILKLEIWFLALTYKTERGQVDYYVYAYITAFLFHRVINKKTCSILYSILAQLQ